MAELNEHLDLDNMRKIYKNYVLSENKNSAIDMILRYLIRGFDLSVHGQYRLSYMNKKIRTEPESHLCLELKKILNKEYSCLFPTYNFKNMQEMMEYINKIKCVACNIQIEKSSNFCCNCGTKNNR